MHVAAMRPSAVTKEDLDPQAVAKEREILTRRLARKASPRTS